MSGSAQPATLASILGAVPVASVQTDTTGASWRHDGGWVNTIAGLNVTGRDKRTASGFEVDIVDIETAQLLWRGDDIAARVIEEPVDDALRRGFKVKVAQDDDMTDTDPRARMLRRRQEKRSARKIAKQVAAEWKRLGLRTAVATSVKYERAYGGSAIMLGVNDGAIDLRQPLNLNAPNLKIEWLTVLEPREVQPIAWYGNPRAPKFGDPELYQINPQPAGPARFDPRTLNAAAPVTTTIHESRLIVFGGIKVTRRPVFGVLSGHGDSILTRLWRVLRDFNQAFDGSSVLISDFAQAVFKMKGLAEILTADNAGKFRTRMELANYSRSALRAILIDAELEEFERKATPVTGLADLLDRHERRLAAACGIPLTRLMGMSPGGLNATGESDVRFYYDKVAGIQTDKLAPAIETITRIIFNTIGGEPGDWCIDFPPLWSPTDKERAETRKLVAESDKIYLEASAVDARTVARSRWGGDEYSDDMIIDFDEDDAIDAPPDDDIDEEQIRGPATVPSPFGAPAPSAVPLPAPVAGAKQAPPAAAPGSTMVTPPSIANLASAAGAAAGIIKQATSGEIPKQAAQALFEIMFAMSPENAARLMASVPDKPEPKPVVVAAPPPPRNQPPRNPLDVALSA